MARTKEEARQYGMGYNAGRANRYPTDKPTIPPDAIIARLTTALKEMLGAVRASLSTFDPDDDLCVELEPLIVLADDALGGLDRWIGEREPVEEQALKSRLDTALAALRGCVVEPLKPEYARMKRTGSLWSGLVKIRLEDYESAIAAIEKEE